ncbi:MAG: UxaA family hydrolase [Archaeoglobaceae archaeon]
MKVYLHDEKDNVVVALDNLKPGDKIEAKGKVITVRQEIPFGHKVAIENIPKGSYIIKYGEVIGVATTNIEEGEHVHIHNLKSLKYT